MLPLIKTRWKSPQCVALEPFALTRRILFVAAAQKESNVEHSGVITGVDSTFLPFRGGDSRFHNFALFTELLGLTIEGKEFDAVLEFVSQNFFSSYSLQGLYILKNQGPQSWKVTQSNSAVIQEVYLSADHAIGASFESGAIGFASTNGRLFAVDDDSLDSITDSYRLLLIPLIDNLVPRSLLVAIVGNSQVFSPADIELFSFVQVILSFTAYGSKPLDKADYDF